MLKDQRQHQRFVMDGYRDLDGITDDLWENGYELGHKSKELLRATIAVVVYELLARVPEGYTARACADELHDAMTGIESAALEDEIV